MYLQDSYVVIWSSCGTLMHAGLLLFCHQWRSVCKMLCRKIEIDSWLLFFIFKHPWLVLSDRIYWRSKVRQFSLYFFSILFIYFKDNNVLFHSFIQICNVNAMLPKCYVICPLSFHLLQDTFYSSIENLYPVLGDFSNKS